MQAYEGYIDNGQFFPIGIQTRIAGRRRVIVTVLDEPEEMPREKYLSLLDELCGSIDDPTFSEPPEIPWEYNAIREDIV